MARETDVLKELQDLGALGDAPRPIKARQPQREAAPATRKVVPVAEPDPVRHPEDVLDAFSDRLNDLRKALFGMLEWCEEIENSFLVSDEDVPEFEGPEIDGPIEGIDVEAEMRSILDDDPVVEEPVEAEAAEETEEAEAVETVEASSDDQGAGGSEEEAPAIPKITPTMPLSDIRRAFLTEDALVLKDGKNGESKEAPPAEDPSKED